MGKGKLIVDAAEAVTKGGGKAAKAAKKAAKQAEAAKAAKAAQAQAATAKQRLLGKAGSFARSHPLVAGAGAAVGIGATLGTVGALADGGSAHGTPDLPVLFPPPPADAGTGTAAGGGGAGIGGDPLSSGVIEWDAETLTAFVGALRQEATALEPLLTQGATAFDTFRAGLAADSLGTKTRLGVASPVLAELDVAVGELATAYSDIVTALITQLAGDADRVGTILQRHEDNEAANVEAITSIDTEGI